MKRLSSKCRQRKENAYFIKCRTHHLFKLETGFFLVHASRWALKMTAAKAIFLVGLANSSSLKLHFVVEIHPISRAVGWFPWDGRGTNWKEVILMMGIINFAKLQIFWVSLLLKPELLFVYYCNEGIFLPFLSNERGLLTEDRFCLQTNEVDYSVVEEACHYFERS